MTVNYSLLQFSKRNPKMYFVRLRQIVKSFQIPPNRLSKVKNNLPLSDGLAFWYFNVLQNDEIDCLQVSSDQQEDLSSFEDYATRPQYIPKRVRYNQIILKPLNVITLGPRIFYYFNQMIILTHKFNLAMFSKSQCVTDYNKRHLLSWL